MVCRIPRDIYDWIHHGDGPIIRRVANYHNEWRRLKAESPEVESAIEQAGKRAPRKRVMSLSAAPDMMDDLYGMAEAYRISLNRMVNSILILFYNREVDAATWFKDHPITNGIIHQNECAAVCWRRQTAKEAGHREYITECRKRVDPEMRASFDEMITKQQEAGKYLPDPLAGAKPVSIPLPTPEVGQP